jgi:hypothetical protein
MQPKTFSIFLVLIFPMTLLVTGTSAVAQTETVLHSFDGKKGVYPEAGLIFDSSGNLYGATFCGGSGTCSESGFNGCWIVFELSPKAGGG